MQRLRAGITCFCLIVICGCRSFGPPAGYKAGQLLLPDSPTRDRAALHDKNPDIRRWSILSLAQQGDERITPEIALHLNPSLEPSPLVRSTAAIALMRLGDQRAVPALDRACSDNEPFVRADAVLALGALGGPDTVPRLTGILRDDNDIRVRRHAARALALTGSRTAFEPLIEELANQDDSLAFECHRALGRLSGKDLPPVRHAWTEWVKAMDASRPETSSSPSVTPSAP